MFFRVDLLGQIDPEDEGTTSFETLVTVISQLGVTSQKT
jgi:hypothetical protein